MAKLMGQEQSGAHSVFLLCLTVREGLGCPVLALPKAAQRKEASHRHTETQHGMMLCHPVLELCRPMGPEMNRGFVCVGI